ncbi:MAG TPA: MFS transporter [Micromonosporaceae bacterium]
MSGTRVATRWAVFAAAASGTFLGALDLNVVPVAISDMQRAFPGTPVARLSWVTTGYAITFSATLLPAGALADRLGRARVFLAGLSLFTLASIGCAAAGSPAFLIAARLVQGIGGGVLTPLAIALILPAFGAARGLALGLWSATVSAAATAGPAVGGLLVAAWNWRLVFIVTAAIGVPAVLLGIRVLPREPVPDSGEPADLPGAAVLAAALGLACLGLTYGDGTGLAMVVGGAALACLFAARTARHNAPLIRPGLLATRAVWTANVALLLFGMLFFTVQLSNALFLTGPEGHSALGAGLALTPGAVATTVTGYLAGPASARTGPRLVAAAGLAGFGIGAAVLAWASARHLGYASGLLPGFLVAGAGAGAAFTALSGAAVAAVPAAELGAGSALSVASRSVGASLGFAVLGSLLAAHAGGTDAYRTGWWGAALGVAVVVGAVLLIPPGGLRRVG